MPFIFFIYFTIYFYEVPPILLVLPKLKDHVLGFSFLKWLPFFCDIPRGEPMQAVFQFPWSMIVTVQCNYINRLCVHNAMLGHGNWLEPKWQLFCRSAQKKVVGFSKLSCRLYLYLYLYLVGTCASRESYI